MSIREEAKNGRRTRIVAAARSLMKQSGEGVFSMRALATEARVSIATPYNLFGSKQAVMLAVLETDLNQYRQQLRQVNVDELDLLFSAATLATELCESEPEFYKAVLTSVSSGDLQDVLKGSKHDLWRYLVKNAIEAGFLVEDTEPDEFAIILHYGFLAAIMGWVDGRLSIQESEARAHYGFALSLAAMATDQCRQRMQDKIMAAQANLHSIRQGQLLQSMTAGPLHKAYEDVRPVVPDGRREASGRLSAAHE